MVQDIGIEFRQRLDAALLVEVEAGVLDDHGHQVHHQPPVLEVFLDERVVTAGPVHAQHAGDAVSDSQRPAQSRTGDFADVAPRYILEAGIAVDPAGQQQGLARLSHPAHDTFTHLHMGSNDPARHGHAGRYGEQVRRFLIDQRERAAVGEQA